MSLPQHHLPFCHITHGSFFLLCRGGVSVSQPDQVPDSAWRDDLWGSMGRCSSLTPTGGCSCPCYAPPATPLSNSTHPSLLCSSLLSFPFFSSLSSPSLPFSENLGHGQCFVLAAFNFLVKYLFSHWLIFTDLSTVTYLKGTVTYSYLIFDIDLNLDFNNSDKFSNNMIKKQFREI